MKKKTTKPKGVKLDTAVKDRCKTSKKQENAKVCGLKASLHDNASATTDSSCKLWIKFQCSSSPSSISKWAIAERDISSMHNGRRASFLL